MVGVDDKTPKADETTFTLDCTDISPYAEPDRYDAARAESDRKFEKLDRELARLRQPIGGQVPSDEDASPEGD